MEGGFGTLLFGREACIAQTLKRMTRAIKNLNSLRLVCLRDHRLSLNTARPLASAEMLIRGLSRKHPALNTSIFPITWPDAFWTGLVLTVNIV